MEKPPKKPPQTIINIGLNIRKNLGSVTGVAIAKARDVIIYDGTVKWVVVIAAVAIVGFVLVILRLITQPPFRPLVEPSPAAAFPSTALILSPTPPSPKPTLSFTSEALSVDSSEPTPTVISVIPTKTLDLVDLCINPKIWTPSRGEAYRLDDMGCWDLSEWGIEAAAGGLKLRTNSWGPNTAIYREITPNTHINFSLFITSTGTLDDNGPRLVLRILPDTLRSQNAGWEKRFQNDPNSFRFSLGGPQKITLKLDDNELTIIEGLSSYSEPPVRLTFEAKYFWVGIESGFNGSLDAEVSDLQFEDN